MHAIPIICVYFQTDFVHEQEYVRVQGLGSHVIRVCDVLPNPSERFCSQVFVYASRYAPLAYGT